MASCPTYLQIPPFVVSALLEGRSPNTIQQTLMCILYPALPGGCWALCQACGSGGGADGGAARSEAKAVVGNIGLDMEQRRKGG